MPISGASVLAKDAASNVPAIPPALPAERARSADRSAVQDAAARLGEHANRAATKCGGVRRTGSAMPRRIALVLMWKMAQGHAAQDGCVEDAAVRCNPGGYGIGGAGTTGVPRA
jgi:hypothetical protein